MFQDEKGEYFHVCTITVIFPDVAVRRSKLPIQVLLGM